MFKITKDCIADEENGSRVGFTGTLMPQYAMEQIMGLDARLPAWESTVEFRLKDDDGAIHYYGILDDDPDCANQLAALRFGETDTGACYIEVKREGQWKLEIG